MTNFIDSSKLKDFADDNFSFSLSVFKRLVLQTCKNQGLIGKGFLQTRKNKGLLGKGLLIVPF